MTSSEENQGHSANPEPNMELGPSVPASGSDLGTRILVLCQQMGWQEAAKAADKSVKQMRRYVHGGDPPVSVLAHLAEAAKVSLEWLVTGRVLCASDCAVQEKFLKLELLSTRRIKDTEARTPKELENIKELERAIRKQLAINDELWRVHERSGRDEHAIITRSADVFPVSQNDPMLFDEDLHALVVDGIAAVYKEEGVRLPPSSLGRLAARIHGDLAAAYDDPDDRRMALKLALQQLRRDLRKAPDQTQGKHSV